MVFSKCQAVHPKKILHIAAIYLPSKILLKQPLWYIAFTGLDNSDRVFFVSVMNWISILAETYNSNIIYFYIRQLKNSKLYGGSIVYAH